MDDDLTLTCPVIRRARRTVKLSNNLEKEMRQLRRDLLRCRRCPRSVNGGSCPMLAEYNDAIQQAILEINEEWNMF